jgi:hypothetical protein
LKLLLQRKIDERRCIHFIYKIVSIIGKEGRGREYKKEETKNRFFSKTRFLLPSPNLLGSRQRSPPLSGLPLFFSALTHLTAGVGI